MDITSSDRSCNTIIMLDSLDSQFRYVVYMVQTCVVKLELEMRMEKPNILISMNWLRLNKC